MANNTIPVSGSNYMYECRCIPGRFHTCSQELRWANDGRKMMPDWRRQNFR